jgi:hypothetical protein
VISKVRSVMGPGPADELVHPLLREGAVAIGVGVGSARLAGWLSVDADADGRKFLVLPAP